MQNWTTHEQILPISLQLFEFNSDLLKAPKMLKDYVHQFQHKKEISDFQKRHNSDNGGVLNKNSIVNNNTIYVFPFVTAILSLVVTTIVIYIVCRHTKMKSLITSFALQQIREADMVSK